MTVLVALAIDLTLFCAVFFPSGVSLK